MKISVCIPTYNQAQYLELAIRSCVTQSIQPFEIVVSDDCSTDNTSELLKRLVEEIPYLISVRQPENLGISGNTDSCLRMASGDFIVRLDSDDYLGTQYLEKLSTLLVAHPSAAYAHAAVQEIDQHGTYIVERRLIRKTGFQSADNALKSAIHGYRVAANIIMFRRQALIDVNYNKGRPDYVEDFHLSASLAAAGHGNVYLDEILAYYRLWVDNGRVRQRRKLMEILGLYRVFEEVLQKEYVNRGWNVDAVKKKRSDFASKQADCLSWDVYTSNEKEELLGALRKLSSSNAAKIHFWLYMQGYGRFVFFYRKVKSLPKATIKALFLRFKANYGTV